jgi:hypothetical protein
MFVKSRWANAGEAEIEAASAIASPTIVRRPAVWPGKMFLQTEDRLRDEAVAGEMGKE